jgi:hypothetical protein
LVPPVAVVCSRALFLSVRDENPAKPGLERVWCGGVVVCAWALALAARNAKIAQRRGEKEAREEDKEKMRFGSQK